MSTSHVEPEWAMVTVLFVDIRGFTAFADRSTAREAVEYLNEFFALAVPTIAEHGGRVDKLLGDGLLAVFAASDHADRALWRPPTSSPRWASTAGSASASTRGSCSWGRSARGMSWRSA